MTYDDLPIPDISRPQAMDGEPDLSEFLHLDAQDLDPRPVLIEPFIREGDLVYFTGAQGQGKSTLVADLLLACTLPMALGPGSNELLAGCMRVDREIFGTGGRVVLLDAENDVAEWFELVEASARARGLEMTHPAVEFAMAGVRWRRARDYAWDELGQVRGEIDRFLDACEALGTRIIVIDSLHQLWTRDLNNPQWVTQGLDVLKDQAKRRRMTVIALVHTSRDFKDKLGKNKYLPAFSSQQEKVADTIIGLRRNLKDGLLRLVLVKRRAGKWNREGSVAEVLLSDTFGGYEQAGKSWPFENPKDKIAATRGLSATRIDLLERLSTLREFGQGELGGSPRARVAAARALQKAGCVELVRGEGKRGDPYVYRVTREGHDVIQYLRTKPELLPSE